MNIDYVIKLGGSLLYDFSQTKQLLAKLFLTKTANFAVTVGSGKLGEIYKDFISSLGDDQICFKDSLRDFSNVQSINASVLAALNENYVVCTTEDEVQIAIASGKVPILDSRGFMHVFQEDKYQKGDVRAANLCNHFGCSNLVIVTNVNGVYDKDPRYSSDSHLISRMTAYELQKMGRTSVDEGLAEKINKYKLRCYVVGIDDLLAQEYRVTEEILGFGTTIEEGGKIYERQP